MRSVFVGAMALVVIGCSGASRADGQATVQSDEGGQLTQRLADLTSRLEESGASGVIAVSIRGEEAPVQVFGLADREEGDRVEAGTLFDIGSITKQFTAAAILRLEVEGRLRTTDRLSEHLGVVPVDKEEITLHHLLTHSSGLPPAVGGDYEPLDRQAFLDRALAARLVFEPGAGYEYSNVGYSLLAAIVELKTGGPFEEYVQSALLRPAGLTSTGYGVPVTQPRGIAVGYAGDNRWGRPSEKAWGEDGPYWNLRGNGGMLSTGPDMLQWHRALLDDRVLPEEARAKLYVPYVEEGEGAGTHYGYGWALFPTSRGTTLVTHNGGNGVFFADFLRFLEEDVVVFFATNAAASTPEALGFEVARMVFDEGYTPVLDRPIASRDVEPESPLGRLARSIVSALQDGSGERLGDLVDEVFEPGFSQAVPRERHLSVLARVAGAVDGLEVERVAADQDFVSVYFMSPEGSPLILRIGYEGASSPRVTGMALDRS